MAVEHISAVTFVVADMARSVAFYDALGLERLYGGPEEPFTSYGVGDGYVNLQRGDPGETRTWGRVILHVDDVDAMWRTVRDAGGIPDAEPADAPWGERFFHVRDPDGHELSFARPIDDPVLRPATPQDLDGLHELNQEEVPAVGSLDRDAFGRLVGMAARTTVAWLGGRVGGFVVLFEEGSPYASPNYRWFAERYDRFVYVDRVVVAPDARRKGVASALYREAIRAAGDRPLTAEVNRRPPNDASLSFHHARGFVEVGRRTEPGGRREVAMLLRDPTGAA